VFCRSLFVLLSLFCWPLYCLSFFDLRLLIAPLVFSDKTLITIKWHQSSFFCYKYGDKSWMRKGRDCGNDKRNISVVICSTFRNGKPSRSGGGKTFEVMNLTARNPWFNSVFVSSNHLWSINRSSNCWNQILNET
jgi:hypothetical protein